MMLIKPASSVWFGLPVMVTSGSSYEASKTFPGSEMNTLRPYYHDNQAPDDAARFLSVNSQRSSPHCFLPRLVRVD